MRVNEMKQRAGKYVYTCCQYLDTEISNVAGARTYTIETEEDID